MKIKNFNRIHNSFMQKIRKVNNVIKTSGIRGLILNIRIRIANSKRSNYVKKYLNRLMKKKSHLFIIQIGAHVGKTSNDPLYEFLNENCSKSNESAQRVEAILVEPVRHLYNQLIENYSRCEGIHFENVAIAEKNKTMKFYRLRENIVPENYGMPFWIDQLGSLLPERMKSLWDNYENNEEYKQFIIKHTVTEEVKCITVTDLVNKYNVKEIDLLQIDTEGYDYNIIKAIDFKQIKPRAINYEHVLLHRNENKCRKLLMENGYELFSHGQDTTAILKD